MSDSHEPKSAPKPAIPAALSKVIGQLIVREGGLSEDPDDPGGLTKYGISQRAYPDVDIRNLTVEGAADIYYTDYYLKSGLDRVPPACGEVILDMAVHAGIRAAVRLAQKAVGTRPDGHIGPKTAAAFLPMPVSLFKRRYALERLLHYLFVILRRPSSVKYARGWFRRALELS